jgi:hypothetical protein
VEDKNTMTDWLRGYHTAGAARRAMLSTSTAVLAAQARGEVEHALDRIATAGRWPWRQRLSLLIDLWLMLEEQRG